MMRILGMMSGTSLDGVDAAILETDGERIGGFGRTAFRPYDPDASAALHAALGLWPGDARVAHAAQICEDRHAALARDFPEAALIAFHGQTLAHEPGGRGTHQAGAGWRLARATGRPVVWDFRREDVRRGGQGAPLIPFFHHALARWAVDTGRLAPAPVVMLNLGGVGNLTWADPRIAAPESACLAFDTGPANAPLNDLMRARHGLPYDAGGALSASGEVSERVIGDFLTHPFFDQPPPKSLDRDAWAGLSAAVAGLPLVDAAATLTHAAAAAVGAALRWLPAAPARILVCGGGRHNRAMMVALSRRTGVEVAAIEALGLDGDMIEAQGFAFLGARVLRGLPLSAPMTTGVPAPASGGRISVPVATGQL